MKEYFKYKIESEVSFCPATPAAQKEKLHFTVFPTSSLAAAGFSGVTYCLSYLVPQKKTKH